MEAAEARAGRLVGATKLCAVSKRKPVADVIAALEAGCVEFGENYVHELLAKARELGDRPVAWHAIGHVQTNKVKALLGCPALALVHSVDRDRLVDAIERHAEGPVDVLVQVRLSEEESKSGCEPAALGALLAHAGRCQRLRVRGLMTMPPPVDDPEKVRPIFRRLRELRDAHGGAERLPELSMGMTQDFEVAIEEGATIVRIGSAIFGPRSA
jgi:hypothetical protein